MQTHKLTGRIRQREPKKARNKCRKWELIVNLPPTCGKYPIKTRAFDGTYTQAQAALRAFIDELEARYVPNKMTLAAYLSAWHERRAASGLFSRRTITGETSKINAICRHLGAMKLSDITPADIENAYTRLMQGDTPTGKPYSAKSIDNVHRCISSAFNDAIRDNLTRSNPCKAAKRPKIPDARRNVPSVESVDALIHSMDIDEPAQAAILLIAAFGLRSSEAVAVTWGDYDGAALSINKASEENGDMKPTKNTHSRIVPAPGYVRTILDAHRKGDGERIAPILQDPLRRWWNKHRANYEMDGVRLHDLRHAYATRLALANIHPRIIMALGGWETISVCMEIYTHVNDDLGAYVDNAFSACAGQFGVNSGALG